MQAIITKKEMWVPGAIFKLTSGNSKYNGQECEFVKWFYDEIDYETGYPIMKFSDGYIESGFYALRYKFVRFKQPLYCKSLL